MWILQEQVLGVGIKTQKFIEYP